MRLSQTAGNRGDVFWPLQPTRRPSCSTEWIKAMVGNGDASLELAVRQGIRSCSGLPERPLRSEVGCVALATPVLVAGLWARGFRTQLGCCKAPLLAMERQVPFILGVPQPATRPRSSFAPGS